MSQSGQDLEQVPEPDEPVDPAAKTVPESDRGGPEDYHVAEVDPEVPIAGAVADRDEELYGHAEEAEEDRA